MDLFYGIFLICFTIFISFLKFETNIQKKIAVIISLIFNCLIMYNFMFALQNAIFSTSFETVLKLLIVLIIVVVINILLYKNSGFEKKVYTKFIIFVLLISFILYTIVFYCIWEIWKSTLIRFFKDIRLL